MEIEELSESVPITKDIVEDERPDKLSKGQKFSKAIFIDLNSSKNQEPMKQKITKDNLTSEKQDCSTRNPLLRDTTVAQKSHDKNKISKSYWINCRLCRFKSKTADLMIEHMCSSHVGKDDVEINKDEDKETAASEVVEKKSKTAASKVEVEKPSVREFFELPHGWTKLVVHRENQKSMHGKTRHDIYLICPGSKRTKLQSDAQLERFLQENPDIECDQSVTSTKATVHRKLLLEIENGKRMKAAKAEDLKKKLPAKKGAVNKKGKSDVGKDDVETNNDGDKATTASDVVEKKSMTAAAKKNRPAAKTKKEKCPYCEKQVLNLMRHQVTAHSPRTRNPYDCTLCNSVFPNKERQSWHFVTAHGLKLKPEIIDSNSTETGETLSQINNLGFSMDEALNIEMESSESENIKFKNTFQEVSTAVTGSTSSIQGNLETPTKVSSENQEHLVLEESIVSQLGLDPNIPMIFKCTICDLEFNSLDTLTEHFSSDHAESQITFAGSDVPQSQNETTIPHEQNHEVHEVVTREMIEAQGFQGDYIIFT